MWRPQEGVRCPGTGVTDGCELPCGCWELNPGPLEKLLTAEPSLQPLIQWCNAVETANVFPLVSVLLSIKPRASHMVSSTLPRKHAHNP